MTGRRQSQGPLDRLSAAVFMEKHYPCPLPLTGKGRRKQRDCCVCMNTKKRPKQRKSLTTWCSEYKVPLCIGKCYKDYYTLEIALGSANIHSNFSIRK